MTIILYLIGKSGTGKYTIAKEIAKAAKYIVCDNQLINHSIFSLLKYDGLTHVPEYAWNAIGGIRKIILDFITKIPENNYILTNVLGEVAGDHEIFDRVEQVATARNSIFVPVKLIISIEENIKRIQNKDRLAKLKSIDVEDVNNQSLINIAHHNLLTLDVSELSKEKAASKILLHIEKIQNNNLG